MARDPYWLHAYWEVAEAKARRAPGGRWVLRVYELAVAQFAPDTIRRWFDVELAPGARDWFLEVGHPASWWCLELGVIGGERFTPLARSNLVETPADRPSDEIDAAWPPSHPSLFAHPVDHLSSLRPPRRAD
ncbi:MAG: DUF4912 domain-containing protein [Candidatus Omnitrophica bacterium]|nr:DUF4912 domain-containing protein [Candidatus Omnitrophota bacterium]